MLERSISSDSIPFCIDCCFRFRRAFKTLADCDFWKFIDESPWEMCHGKENISAFSYQTDVVEVAIILNIWVIRPVVVALNHHCEVLKLSKPLKTDNFKLFPDYYTTRILVMLWRGKKVALESPRKPFESSTHVWNSLTLQEHAFNVVDGASSQSSNVCPL